MPASTVSPEVFARAILEGETNGEAYAMAGGKSDTPTGLKTMGSRFRQRPDVQKLIDDGLAGVKVDYQVALKGLLPKAVKVLEETLITGSEKERAAAAKEILKQTVSSTPKEVNVNNTNVNKIELPNEELAKQLLFLIQTGAVSESELGAIDGEFTEKPRAGQEANRVITIQEA